MKENQFKKTGSGILQLADGPGGKKIVAYEGFGYNADKLYKNNVTQWECNKKTTSNCQVRLYSSDNSVYSITGEHNHPPIVKQD